MGKHRSPIEMMVDKACGFDPSNPPQPRELPIELHCPKCKEVLKVDADETDPEGTAKIETACPKCQTEDFKISYFDAEGKLIESL